jgi:sec-independent protein translocase protein TatA
MGLGLENPLHIAIVLVVVLLVFGAKKLPEMGRGLGQGMREFKDGVTGRHIEPTVTAAPEQLEDRGRVPGA